jgi:hypothetical protein
MEPSSFAASYARRPVRRPSIDGIRSRSTPRPQVRQAGTMPRQTTVPPVVAYKPRPIAKHVIKTPAAKKHPIWERLKLTLLMSGSIIAGLFVQASWFGITLIIIYGICAVAFRIKSYITFTLAIIALAAVVAIMATKPGTELANNFATYAFLLLTIGVITLTIEARPQRRKKKRR